MSYSNQAEKRYFQAKKECLKFFKNMGENLNKFD